MGGKEKARPELRPYRASSWKIEEALKRLEQLRISESKKDKIQTVIQGSRFNGVYCDYFLSADPDRFRDSLEHNQQFVKDAADYGIDAKVIEEGVAFSKIELGLDHANAFAWGRLVNYANELCRQMKNLYEFIQTELENPRYERLLKPEGTNWRVEYDDHELHPETRKVFEKTSKKAIASPKFKETNRILKRIIKGMELACDEPDSEKRELLIEKSAAQIRNSTLLTLRNQPESTPDKIEDEVVDELEWILHNELKKASQQTFEQDFREHLKPVIELYDQYVKNDKVTMRDLNVLSDMSKYNERIEDIKRRLVDSCSSLRILMDLFMEDKYFYALDEGNFPDINYDMRGILNLEHHIREYHHVFSSKLKNVGSVKYSVQVERLHPEDVVFGNDGGCCLAIDDNPESGYYIPFYMLDKATMVFGIYQQAGDKKPKRVGMVLAFATVDVNNDPVLLCNSCELSGASNPLDTRGLNKLVNYINKYLHKFSNAAGFKRIAMGNHNFNTAKNFMEANLLQEPDYAKEELMKLPDLEDTPEFYSEVLDNIDSPQKSSYSKKGAWAFMVRT
jgi:hypothetical protein